MPEFDLSESGRAGPYGGYGLDADTSFTPLRQRTQPALLPSTTRALNRRLAVEQTQCRVPSIAASILRRTEMVWSDVRGSGREDEADSDTQYRIGSITKTFISALVLKLRDEGVLRLDDPVEKYVPGSPVGDRTLLHLLSHASGLAADVPGEWWERTQGRDWPALATALDRGAVRHDAGRRYHYSNPGMAMLGLVVERARGRSWFDVLRQEILLPLGMDRTTYHPARPFAQGYAVHPYADVLLREPHTDTQAMSPAGQLWSNVGDLSRWCRFLAGETGDVLSPGTVEEMRQPITVDDDDSDATMSGYGLGLQVYRTRGRHLIGHAGSMPGFLAWIAVDLDDQVSTVTVANVTAGLSGTLHLDLMDLLTELEPQLPPEWRPSHVPQEVLEIVGVWHWGPRPHTLRALPDGTLDLTGEDGTRVSRFSATVGAWTGLDGYFAGEPLRVGRHSDGSVSHLDIGTFCFTRSPYDPSAPIPGGIPDEGWHTPS